jgi:hypothetical protein
MAVNRTVRDFGLGVVTIGGVWGASTLSPDVQVVGDPRSSQWPKVRATYLQSHPICEACGQKDHLNVHHVIPFHNDPSKELDPTNMITLCTDGPGNMNCHLVIGHAGNFRGHNVKVREDAKRVREMLKSIKFE